MAATAEVPAPRAGLFSFVKLGVLIPARRWKLFVQVFALAAVPSTALFFVKTLALQPLAAAAVAVNLEAGVDGTDAFPTAVRSFLSEHLWLLQAGAGYLTANAVLGSAIKIANIFASIMACTHGHDHDHEHHHTLVYFLGGVKRNIWGPVVTASFGYVLQAAYIGTTVVSALSLFLLAEYYPPWMLILHVVLLFVALLFYMYLEVVCAVSMVASVAEPGLHGMAAVRRAWQLMRGNNAQVVLYVASTWALGRAASPLYHLAMAWLPHRASSVVRVDAAFMHLLVAALDVFSVAAVTAYYFQCRKSAKEDCTKSNETPNNYY